MHWWFSKVFETRPLKEVSLVSPLFSESLKEHLQLHNENYLRSLYWGWKKVGLTITWEFCLSWK